MPTSPACWAARASPSSPKTRTSRVTACRSTLRKAPRYHCGPRFQAGEAGRKPLFVRKIKNLFYPERAVVLASGNRVGPPAVEGGQAPQPGDDVFVHGIGRLGAVDREDQ